jgi:hypothetical protein
MHTEARDHTDLCMLEKQVRFSELPSHRKGRYHSAAPTLAMVAHIQ